MSSTGILFRRSTLDDVDPMVVPMLEFLEKDEMNRHFFGEIGTSIMATEKKTAKLLRLCGCYAPLTKVVDVYKGRIKSKISTTTLDDLNIEWKYYPRKLRKRLPLPLLDRVPASVDIPGYLWTEKYRSRTRILKIILTFPTRYDYRIKRSAYDKEIVVEYRHPLWGKLRGEVVKPALDDIKKEDFPQSEIFEKVHFSSNGEDVDLSHIFHRGLQYRNALRKAAKSGGNKLENIIKVMGFSSVEDYLFSVYS